MGGGGVRELHILPEISRGESHSPGLPGHRDRPIAMCADDFEGVPVGDRDPPVGGEVTIVTARRHDIVHIRLPTVDRDRCATNVELFESAFLDQRVDRTDSLVGGRGDQHPPTVTISLMPHRGGLTDRIIDTRCRREPLMLLVGVERFDTTTTQLQRGVTFPRLAEA